MVVTKLTAKDGTDLRPSKAAGGLRGLWEVANVASRVSASTDSTGPGASADIEGFVRLEFGIGEERLNVELKESPKPVTVQGLTFTVTKVDRLEREVRVTVEGKLKRPYPSFKTISPKYGLLLRDPSGKLHHGRKGKSPYVRGGFKMELIYSVPRTPGRWSLVLVYPERTRTRDYPFRLESVPIP